MAISTERKATQEDLERVEAAAKRFCERHGIERTISDSYYDEVEFKIYNTYNGPDSYLIKLWKACFRRAVKSAWSDTIAYGYIGKTIN